MQLQIVEWRYNGTIYYELINCETFLLVWQPSDRKNRNGGKSHIFWRLRFVHDTYACLICFNNY